MRIGIDVRYLSHGLVGGVHAYVANFVPPLVELAKDHQVFLYADDKRPFELHDLPPHVTVRVLRWRNPVSSIYHDLFLRRQMAGDGIEVAHFPANYGFGPAGGGTVITLHDALNILPLREILRGLKAGSSKRTPYLVAMTTYLHYVTLLAVRRAKLILTDSGHAVREIHLASGIGPDRIVSVPLGLAPDLRRIEDPELLDDVRQRHGLDRPYVLADALKNPGTLVKAWGMLPAELRERAQIVFFSRRPDPLPVVHDAVAAGHARLLVRPSREDLIALFSMAEAFVFPSWIEGFGIPVLEAMACGAPVIASDRGAIPEVLGEAGLMADAQDAETFSRFIAQVLTSRDEGLHLRERGLSRAADFSWRSTAERILGCYERAVSLPSTSRKETALAVESQRGH